MLVRLEDLQRGLPGINTSYSHYRYTYYIHYAIIIYKSYMHNEYESVFTNIRALLDSSENDLAMKVYITMVAYLHHSSEVC